MSGEAEGNCLTQKFKGEGVIKRKAEIGVVIGKKKKKVATKLK